MSGLTRWLAFCAAWIAGAATVQAQESLATGGALIVVPAYGEVRQANDEARATFMIEEQDKDKSAAASRVNQKMKQGMEIVKREDPTAILKTRGYFTYPVYQDEQPRPAGKARQPAGWRVGQYLEAKTTNLSALPRMVSAAQHILALHSLQFGLADATRRKLDEKRIQAAYAHLTERITAIAKAMGRSPAEAVLDTVDFEGSGAYAQQHETATAAMPMRSAPAQDAVSVEEPNFEPGETTLQMRVVGKVRFK